MRSSTRIAPSVAALAAFTLVLAACSGGDEQAAPSSAAPAAEGGDLRVALGAVPPALDPGLYSTPPNNLVTFLFSSLTTTEMTDDGTLEIVPDIASEWEQVDDLTWVFTIPSGNTFPNGEPVDAEQMAWSIDYLRNPDNGKASGTQLNATIDTVTVIDEETLQVVTTGPDPLLPNRMAFATAFPPVALAEQGDAFYANPIGTGPYAIDEFVPESSMVFVPNEFVIGEEPVLDSVTFTAIPEDAGRVAALQAGDVDAISRVPTEQVASLESSGMTITDYVEPGTYALTAIASEGPLADPLVRQAIAIAIDRDALNDSILSGFGETASQMASPTATGYCQTLPDFEYDPEAAAELLDEAGYAGEPIVLQASGGYIASDSVLAEAITGMLTEAGLNVEMRIEEYGTYLDAYFDPATRQGLYAWRLFNRATLDAEATMSAFIQETAVHETPWQDDAFDAATRAARTELDTDARDELLCEAATILREGMPVIPLLHLPEIWATTPAVADFSLSLEGLPDLVSVGLRP